MTDLHRTADYEAARRAFSWSIPPTFNFGADVVDRWAEDPGRLALIAVDAAGSERRLTYRDVAGRTNQVAHLLGDLGVGAGDRVLVMLPRIPEWQLVVVACLKLGAIPIPCVTMLTHHDLAYRAHHSGARAVVTTSADALKVEGLDGPKVKIAVGAPPRGWVSLDEANTRPTAFTAATLAADEPAIIYYTSGSTGEPKGVTHAARALYAWRNSAEHWLALDDGDVMWCTSDTGWSKAGTSVLFGPWSRGATALFYDGPFDPEQRLVLLARYRVTTFCAPATELRKLVQLDFSRHDLSALRLTVSAGESVNPEVVDRWTELTGAPVLDGYGQTETLMTVVNQPGQPVKPGSMGRPLPGVDMAVRTDVGIRTAGPAAGQLVIRTPNPQLMLGYWNDPDRTEAAYEDHDGVRWFLTGDNVALDADGYVHFQGRADDVINSAGYRIGPQEVENALIEHPAVLESAVVGAPDPERGEIVHAFVVLAAGHHPSDTLARELQDHTKVLTAPYKYPRRIVFADELPKTVTGKIRRAELRGLARGQAGTGPEPTPVPYAAQADAFFAAIEQGDIEAVRTAFRDDARVWHNVDGVTKAVDEAIAVLRWFIDLTATRRYDDIRRDAVADGIVQRHRLRARSRSGHDANIEACLLLRFDDAGRIACIDEYVDAAQLAPLYAP